MCVLGSSSWWGRRDRVHSVGSSGRGHHISTDQETHRRNSASRLASCFLLFIQSRTPIHRMVPTTLSTDLTLNLSGNFPKHPLGNGGSLEAREMLPRFRALAVLSEDWISASSMHFGSSSSRGQTPSLGLHGRLHSHARNPHMEHRHIHAHIIKTKAGQKRRFSD